MKPRAFRLIGKDFASHERGSALLAAYGVLAVMITMSGLMSISAVFELTASRRFVQKQQALALAEAGVASYLAHAISLPQEFEVEGVGTVLLTSEETPLERRLTATGTTLDGVRKQIVLTFPIEVPEVFLRSVSSGGDLIFKGASVQVQIYDRTGLSGQVRHTAQRSLTLFEDKHTGLNPALTRLQVPDMNGDEAEETWEDFKLFHQEYAMTLPPSETEVLEASHRLHLTSRSQTKGKRFMVVLGPRSGGDVVIHGNDVVAPGQELTIVASGRIIFEQNGSLPEGAVLNLISWSGYEEKVIGDAVWRGVILTHGRAWFHDHAAASVSEGVLIASEDVIFENINAPKVWHYRDPRHHDRLPDGFEGLIGGGRSGYRRVPNSWEEVL